MMTALFVLALAQGPSESHHALRGIRGVQVIVEYMGSDVERDGLAASSIRTDVELRLRQNGIRVYTQAEVDTSMEMAALTPWLYVRVSPLKTPDMPTYIYSVDVVFKDAVRLLRPPEAVMVAVTWESLGSIGRVPIQEIEKIRDAVRDQVDQFVNAYLAANPRTARPPLR